MFTLSTEISGIPHVLSSLDALSSTLSPEEALVAVGRVTAQLTKDHLYGMANDRHRDNVAQNFYKDAADSVIHALTDDGVIITIPKAGMAQRYYGGTIRPVNYSHLWIPVDPESEGKSAGQFHDLIPIISPLTNRGVAIKHEKGRKLKDEKVLFALVPEVTQDADSSVLPSDDDYRSAIAAAINEMMDSLAPLEPLNREPMNQ